MSWTLHRPLKSGAINSLGDRTFDFDSMDFNSVFTQLDRNKTDFHILKSFFSVILQCSLQEKVLKILMKMFCLKGREKHFGQKGDASQHNFGAGFIIVRYYKTVMNLTHD